jgi:shikimate dehydrogenase
MRHVGSDTQYARRNTQYAPRITGVTHLVGIIGWPISHSRSPQMHNAAYAALGLDWAYVPLPVAPERVGDAVRGLVALGFAGANVTVPHKQAVIPYLDELTPVAQAIGAVNTIVVRPDGSLLGDSTDGAGFMADLRAQDMFVGEGQWMQTDKQMVSSLASVTVSPCPRVPVSPRPRVSVSPRLRVPASPYPRVLVIGAGGAARAVVYALAEAGATVAVVNRTLDKAQEICQTIGAALEFTAESAEGMKTSASSASSAVKTWHGKGKRSRLSAHPFPDALAGLAAEADLIVNTTSLGLHAGDPLPWDASVAFGPGQVVYDLIYNRPTELLALARSQGATALDGLGMLVHQGARSAALWTGKNADEFAHLMREGLRTP